MFFLSLSLSLCIDGNFQFAATPPVNVIHPVLWANSRALRNNLRPNGKRVDLETDTGGWSDFHSKVDIYLGIYI